jgi:UDP-sugar pyrophosphorylase
MVVLSPTFKPTVSAAIARVTGGDAVSLTARSALHLDGDITIRSLSLDGALRVIAAPGAQVFIDGLQVVNDGWRVRELTAEEEAGPPTPEVERLRGYALEVRQERVMRFDQPGVYTVRE